MAAELLVKLGSRVSPRTVRRDLPQGVQRGAQSQPWSTVVRHHAHAVLARDFFVVMTATFHATCSWSWRWVPDGSCTEMSLTIRRRIWTAQPFRMVVSGEQPHRWVIHDRDRSYSEGVDATVVAMGLTILKTPVRAPQANAHCERVIGTIRRECLDWMIPCSDRHLRRILQEWVVHDNRGRPHARLGPGIPDRLSGGLHHEYRLERAA
jgi:putative transposase